MPSPIVSILMPVYNAEKYLRLAVDSLLAQTYSVFQLVCIDDGSSDSSLAILREYSSRDSRVIVHSRANTGIVGALNDGLAICAGQFVLRMDADDVSHPGRLEILLNEMTKNPRCVVLGTSFRVIDPDGDTIRVELAETDVERLRANIVAWAYPTLCHPSVLMRKDAIDAVGGYRNTFLHPNIGEDTDLWERLLAIGEIRNVPDVLLCYRYHLESICHKHRKLQKQNMELRNREKNKVSDADSNGNDSDRVFRTEVEEQIARWCRFAIDGGYLKTARKWAFRLYRADPMSRSKLLLLCESMFGTRRHLELTKVYSTIRHEALRLKVKKYNT